MIKNYKLVVTCLLIFLFLGYVIILSFLDIRNANAFLAGYVIIFIDLVILVRLINRLVKQSTMSGFIFFSLLRWLFIGICIYVALVVLGLYKWPFALGIILPFIVVLFTIIYEYFWRKEDGTSS